MISTRLQQNMIRQHVERSRKSQTILLHGRSSNEHFHIFLHNFILWELTSHKSNRHMSVAMQRLVYFVSMVTQQYATMQQSFNALYVTMQQSFKKKNNSLLAGFSVGRSIRNSPLLCNR
jgi:hypothetical protein